MRHEIRYEREARKALKSIPAKVANRIRGKIRQVASDPEGTTEDVKKLQGRPGYRLRVGDYRVIYSLDKDGAVRVLVVHTIGHRKEAYR